MNHAMNFELIIIFVITSLSSFIHSAMGFGYSLFAMAVMPMFLPVATSSAIVNCALLFMCLQITFQLRKSINWKLALPPTIFALAGKPLGVMMLVYLPDATLKRILGLFLVILAIYFFSNKNYRIKPSFITGAIFGFLAGILGGLFNLAGTVTAIYFYNCCDDKCEYSASMNLTFVPPAVMGLIMHYHYGLLTPTVMKSAIFNVIAIVMSTYAGIAVFKKINRQKLGKIIYLYVAVSGMFMMFS